MTWNSEQLLRLEHEWRRLRRGFAYHPAIRIVPLSLNPLDHYEVQYRLRSLVLTDAGELDYASDPSVEISLPERFPIEPPVVRPLTPLFHPNVSADGILLIPPWTPTTTLDQVVQNIGLLLSYRTWDPNVEYNPSAMAWLAQNTAFVPLDYSDVSPDAGGDALQRICRHAPTDLERIRQKLTELCLPSHGNGGREASGIVDAAAELRSQLDLMLDGDIPESIRQPAAMLDEAASQLAGSAPFWQAVADHDDAARAADGALARLSDARQALAAELRQIEARVSTNQMLSLSEVFRLIPQVDVLERHRGNLQTLIAHGAEQLAAASAVADAMQLLDPVDSPAGGGMVSERLAAEAQRTAQSLAEAKKALAGEISYAQPVVRRAEARGEGLRRMADWRQYGDMLERGKQLAGRILELGAEGIEAVFVGSEGGQFGPFAQEQAIQLGAILVVARQEADGGIEVLDAATELPVARRTEMTVELAVPTEPGEQATMTLWLTPPCDQLAAQLEYLLEETRAALANLREHVDAGSSWLSGIDEALCSPAAQKRLAAKQVEAEAQWSELIEDLHGLASIRQRLTTYHLLARLSESVPRLRDALDASRNDSADAAARIAAIIQASTRDEDTGQLQIPYRLSKSYAQQLARRENSVHQVRKLEAALRHAAESLDLRAQSPDLMGEVSTPVFRQLPPLSGDRRALLEQTTDDQIAAMVGQIEPALRKALGGVG